MSTVLLACIQTKVLQGIFAMYASAKVHSSYEAYLIGRQLRSHLHEPRDLYLSASQPTSRLYKRWH